MTIMSHCVTRMFDDCQNDRYVPSCHGMEIRARRRPHTVKADELTSGDHRVRHEAMEMKETTALFCVIALSAETLKRFTKRSLGTRHYHWTTDRAFRT